MKKLMFIIVAVLSLTFASCETEAQVVYQTDGIEYTYYDYEYNYPIVYIETIPYYCIWYHNSWVYRAVPRDRFCFIRHHDHPMMYHPNHHGNRRDFRPNHNDNRGFGNGNRGYGNQRPNTNFGGTRNRGTITPQSRPNFNQGGQMRGGNNLPRNNMSIPRSNSFQGSSSRGGSFQPRSGGSFQGSSSRGGRR